MDEQMVLEEGLVGKEDQIKIELKKRINEIEGQLKKVRGSKCEVYSRVVGYHRPVENWNDGKKDEFNNRHDYIDYI